MIGHGILWGYPQKTGVSWDGMFFFFGFPKHSYIFDFIPKGMMIQMNFLGGESTKRKKVGERLAEDPIDSF
jgi:hypothetical protein